MPTTRFVLPKRSVGEYKGRATVAVAAVEAPHRRQTAAAGVAASLERRSFARAAQANMPWASSAVVVAAAAVAVAAPAS